MLQLVVDRLIYSMLGMQKGDRLADTLNFFIYDSIKILLLLFFMIGAIGVMRTFISQSKIKAWLSGKGIRANVMASLFGAVTPFCSCSSIPIFFSFLKAGVPLGITFSFLVTSPLINEYLVVLMLGFFGWQITLAYILSGMAIGIVAGNILGKMKLEGQLASDMVESEGELVKEPSYSSLAERVAFGLTEARDIVGKLWLWVIVGVGFGAVIHNYVPQEMVRSLISKTGLFSVPLAVVLGVPMYGSCAAIVPIAVVLFQKGIPLGTTLAFMMAVSALSLPEAVMLRRAMKLGLIIIFFFVTTLGIIFTGYLLNALQPILT